MNDETEIVMVDNFAFGIDFIDFFFWFICSSTTSTASAKGSGYGFADKV